MVISVIELRALLSKVKARSGRARAILNRIANISLKQPSAKVTERIASDIQTCLGHFRDIVEIMRRIVD